MQRGIVCAALFAATLVPDASASLEPAPTTVWVAERVSPTARGVWLSANLNWDRRSGRVTFVVANVVRGKPRPYDALTFDSPLTDGPAAYHDGVAYGCHAGSGCDVGSGPGGTTLNLFVRPGDPQPDRIYVVTSGVSAKVQLLNTPGWRLARSRLRARYATSDGSGGGTGAQFFGEHAEAFHEATLPGGPRGSIAVATPPCRPLHNAGYFREGYGNATLTGGTNAVPFDCQKDIHDATAAADKATTWTFRGLVVGSATGTTRLTVIDL